MFTLTSPLALGTGSSALEVLIMSCIIDCQGSITPARSGFPISEPNTIIHSPKILAIACHFSSLHPDFSTVQDQGRSLFCRLLIGSERNLGELIAFYKDPSRNRV
ncbi:hypothetical protein L218DRAFT_406896 [Marasmius fiardii PR-910]|nr:hypothetical protein L218DRAFT_406896 [Marasmius fiardii PR-910]